MSTIREQIVAAAVTALTTGRPSGVPAPVRTRIDSPTEDQLPAFTVYQAIEKVEPQHDESKRAAQRGAVVRRRLLLNIEALTKAATTTTPDKAADPILAWASKALVAAGTFSGLTNQAGDELGTTFEYERKETSFCRATMAFQFEYQSRTSDPEVAA